MGYKGFNISGIVALAVVLFAPLFAISYIMAVLGADQWGWAGVLATYGAYTLVVYYIWKTKWAKRNIK